MTYNTLKLNPIAIFINQNSIKKYLPLNTKLKSIIATSTIGLSILTPQSLWAAEFPLNGGNAGNNMVTYDDAETMKLMETQPTA